MPLPESLHNVEFRHQLVLVDLRNGTQHSVSVPGMDRNIAEANAKQTMIALHGGEWLEWQVVEYQLMGAIKGWVDSPYPESPSVGPGSAGGCD